VGLNTAKALAYSLDTPVIGINHLEGHVLAIFLQEKVEFPFLSLIVSGGHTDLCRVNGFGQYHILGRTRDDAAGESFDKVAKMLGLGYPGGPIIEKIARQGNPKEHVFPRAMLEKDSLDFSFSGLKTSVRNTLLKRDKNNDSTCSDENIAAGFQEAVVDVLIRKALSACKQESLNRIVITGGVAANGYLKDRMTNAARNEGIEVFVPKPIFCTDNAAMIACAGYYRSKHCPPGDNNPFSLDAHPNLPF
jgi:N6-L-threonylcarbamoyladenine synthase